MSIPDPIVLLDARARYVHPAFQMSRASTKTVFDATGKLVTVPANALGWDHDPATGQARGYLAEPSATNLLLNSNDLDGSGWVASNASITADAIAGPDGNGMAKLVENNNDSTHFLRQANITISDGSTVVSSFIAKAAERPAIRAWVMNASSIVNNAHCSFDLTNGSLRGENAQGEGEFVDAGIIDLGDGFYRCWIAGRVGSGVTTARVEYRILPDADSSTSAYQGDGTSGLYIGYCQAEEGSYPTSYIETGAATATRAGDALIAIGLGGHTWWSSERGTVLVDAEFQRPSFLGDVLSINNHGLAFRWVSNGNLHLHSEMASNGLLLPADDVPGRHLLAVAWDKDRVASAADGWIRIGAPALGALPANPAVGLGVRSTGEAAGVGGGRIRRAVYYPAGLLDADLQSLTAIQE